MVETSMKEIINSTIEAKSGSSQRPKTPQPESAKKTQEINIQSNDR